MLIAIYDGLHYLDLADSFRDVAWTATYSFPYDDPILGCLSHFRRICGKFGVQLDSVVTWAERNIDWQQGEQGPFLFVISGFPCSLPNDRVLELVQRGSNLFILPPPLQLIMKANESFQDKHQRFLEELSARLGFGLEQGSERDYNQGKIFYFNDEQVNDLLMEPGPFGGFRESEKTAKERQIESFVERIVTFKTVHIDCQVRSLPTCWPLDEALVIEIDLIHRGTVEVRSATVTIEPTSGFEPLSSMVIQATDLRPHSRRLLTAVVVPRAKGQYSNPVSIRVSADGTDRAVYLPESQIEILCNLSDLLRSSRPTSVDLASALPKFEDIFQSITTASTLLELLRIDSDAVVAKVRKIGEHLCKSIARKQLRNYDSTWTFVVIIKQLFDAGVLNFKAKGYIEMIRIFGNMASHSGDITTTNFNHEDAVVICYALVLFLKEVTDANLL